MQVNTKTNAIVLVVEMVTGLINVLLSLAFYVMNANFSTWKIAMPACAKVSEIAFFCGLIALALVMIARNMIKSSSTRLTLIGLLCCWNQACLSAFIAFIFPFRLS
jgi:hypothetical protein